MRTSTIIIASVIIIFLILIYIESPSFFSLKETSPDEMLNLPEYMTQLDFIEPLTNVGGPSGISGPSAQVCYVANGSWQNSCRNPTIYVEPFMNTLFAECKNSEGTYAPTMLNLNSCASNGCNVNVVDGKLQCSG